MKRPFFFGFVCLAIAVAGSVSAAKAQSPAAGKFYIVGMGTAPDLITARALRVIERADVVLVEEGSDSREWAEYTKGKEVWYWPHSIRKFYGAEPGSLKDPGARTEAEKIAKTREQLVGRIRSAVENGKIVASLQGGDPMMFGLTFFLEMLPRDLPTEIVPGVGSFQAASAAVKMSPPYGYDTNAVILTMADWPGRVDTNEKLMVTGSTMVFYTMHLDYPSLFSQLRRHYPADTPVAVVNDAGSREKEQVIRSTVGRFLQDVDYRNLPDERHILLVGKFLKVGQARKDFLISGAAAAAAPSPKRSR